MIAFKRYEFCFLVQLLFLKPLKMLKIIAAKASYIINKLMVKPI